MSKQSDTFEPARAVAFLISLCVATWYSASLGTARWDAMVILASVACVWEGWSGLGVEAGRRRVLAALTFGFGSVGVLAVLTGQLRVGSLGYVGTAFLVPFFGAIIGGIFARRR